VRVLSTLSFLAALTFAWSMHRADAKAQRFRRTDAAVNPVRMLPADWLHPERYAVEGRPFLDAALGACGAMMLAFLVGFLLFLLGV
jgi:hypothetical protein